MPRRGTGPAPEWDRLYEVAAGQGGYFTLAQGSGSGYSAPLIEYYVRVGRVERVGRGIFRLVHFPTGDHEELIVTWLWSEQRGVFSHETALALQDLSDALPSKQHLTVPAAWKSRRLRVPPNVVLHYADVGKRDVLWKGPVPMTSPIRTISDCYTDGVDPVFVRDARTQAIKRGLFTRAELEQAMAGYKRGFER